MSDTATPNRRSKREIITIHDDESIIEQPVEKIAKKLVEPLSSPPIPPSSELIELQQRVIELEDMYQRACLATKSAELRAERTENLLGSNGGILDGSVQDYHKRMIDLSKKLEDAASLNEQQSRENSALKEELEAAKSRELNLTRENSELKSDMIREIKKTCQLEDELRNMKNVRAKDNERLAVQRSKRWRYAGDVQHEAAAAAPSPPLQPARVPFTKQLLQPQLPLPPPSLMRRMQAPSLSMGSHWVQQSPKPQPPPPPSLKLRDATFPILAIPMPSEQVHSVQQPKPQPPPLRSLKLHDATLPILTIPVPSVPQSHSVQQPKPRPPNPSLKLRDATQSIDIFQLCRPDAAKTISIDSSVGQMRVKFDECGEEKWRRYWDEFGCSGTLSCKACKETISQNIVEHFCSQNHVNKMRACGAAVALHALQHWLNELLRAATGAAARPMQQGAAAGAATINGNTAEEEPMTEAVRKAKDWADLWAHSKKINEPSTEVKVEDP